MTKKPCGGMIIEGLVIALIGALGAVVALLGVVPSTWIDIAILMFADAGLAPVCQAISGPIGKWDLTLLFASAGTLVLVVTAWAAFQPGLEAFSESLVAEPGVQEVREQAGPGLRGEATSSLH